VAVNSYATLRSDAFRERWRWRLIAMKRHLSELILTRSVETTNGAFPHRAVDTAPSTFLGYKYC